MLGIIKHAALMTVNALYGSRAKHAMVRLHHLETTELCTLTGKLLTK
jgi:hypothetical protein